MADTSAPGTKMSDSSVEKLAAGQVAAFIKARRRVLK